MSCSDDSLPGSGSASPRFSLSVPERAQSALQPPSRCWPSLGGMILAAFAVSLVRTAVASWFGLANA